MLTQAARFWKRESHNFDVSAALELPLQQRSFESLLAFFSQSVMLGDVWTYMRLGFTPLQNRE